jgi:U4/U6 small nuclear ribonucleoprotein PRP31
MSSLADELAADLDFSDSDNEQQNSDQEEEQQQEETSSSTQNNKADDTDDSDDDTHTAAAYSALKDTEKGSNKRKRTSVDTLEEDAHNIKKVCRFLYSKQVQDVIAVSSV